MDEIISRLLLVERQVQSISDIHRNTGSFMDDIKIKLERIEQQGVDSKIAAKVLETNFAAHEAQNTKDFLHVDECIHRADNESRIRDEELAEIVSEIRKQFQEVQKLVWKGCGAMLVIVPIINYLAEKYL